MILIHLESNPGHKGRPGQVGGSAPTKGGTPELLAQYDEARERAQNNLTPEQHEVINEYKYSGFAELNRKLRRGSGVPELARKLDSLFEETDKDWVVYRGINATVLNQPVGGILKDKGFLSTSISPDHAKTFGSMATKGTDMMRIKIPSGSKIAFGNYGEQEIILPRSTKLKFVGEDTSGDSFPVKDYIVVN